MEDSSAKGAGGSQDDDSAEDSGAAYLDMRTGANWSQLAYIKASNTEAYDEFGSSVAMSRDGRTITVGARMENSAARTVNGNQNDNEAGQSGPPTFSLSELGLVAVSVFVALTKPGPVI